MQTLHQASARWRQQHEPGSGGEPHLHRLLKVQQAIDGGCSGHNAKLLRMQNAYENHTARLWPAPSCVMVLAMHCVAMELLGGHHTMRS